MKNQILISALFLSTLSIVAQNKNNKIGVEVGGHIMEYNGNLGNSFFRIDNTTFGGGNASVGLYLNKSFDVNVGVSVGHFGYCQTQADKKRVVSLEQRCPGCIDRLGMGELRSMIISGNTSVKYKFANGYMLKEDSKLAPYVYAGIGINYLSDVMKRNCVNVGTHLTINGGAGVKYNITERFNIGYNLGLGCFVTKKVYYTNAIANKETEKDADDIKFEKRKDFYMQHALTLGFNF